jgi:hypothetical protein
LGDVPVGREAARGPWPEAVVAGGDETGDMGAELILAAEAAALDGRPSRIRRIGSEAHAP